VAKTKDQEMRYQLHPWLAENSTIKGVIETEVTTRFEAAKQQWEAEHKQQAEAALRQQIEATVKLQVEATTKLLLQQVEAERKQWEEAERRLIQGLREADRKAMQEIALAKQQAAEEAAHAKQQAAEEAARAEEAEILSLKELISDFVAARCSTPVMSSVQQATKTVQDTDQLKAFFVAWLAFRMNKKSPLC
jgi:predicted negative regulator of RcsB-dependent stress response